MSAHPFELAKEALLKNNTHLAHRLLLDAIEAERYNVRFWLLLAWTTSNVNAAAGYFHQALRLQPGDPVALDGLACIKEKMDQAGGKLVSYGGSVTLPPAPSAIGRFPVHPERISASVSPSPRVIEPLIMAKRLAANLYFLPMLYLAAIILAEITIIFILPQVGLGFHGILLFILILQASHAQGIRERRFTLALALVPLIRLVGLSLPLANIPVIYWYIAIGAPLFVGSIIAARLSKMSPGMLGLNGRKLVWQFLVGLSGIGLGYVEYLVFKPPPLVAQLQWEQIWMPALILFIFGGLLEEFIFRGLMQSAAIQLMSWRGILYISLIFSVLHIDTGSMPNFLIPFAISMFYGLVVVRTGSILGVALSHGLMDIVVYLILPFLPSSPHSLGYLLQNVTTLCQR